MGDPASKETEALREQVRRLQEIVARLEAGHRQMPPHLAGEFDAALARFPYGSLPEDKEEHRG